ncbi:hypothetical protein OHA72_50375 [Dactylosporangium sp. NBC_01737]|uniref:hypothetical protein n=1 Tax=Dactylosporangium sp. NBC_01737 TaxID=2975959 RepID=UPI002E12A3A6|nr:hypothetical protein OHA72_50375 [Dactylosporangium sp. NBC_01737]
MARRPIRRTKQEPVVWWRRLTVPQRWLAGGGAALVVAIVFMVALWPQSAPESREREYLQFTACLLTPADGVRDAAAEPVWKAMQDASLQTRAKVQYLEISGAQTVDNAVTFLNSLAQGGCDLIFAAGDLPVRAVAKGAATFPAERFVTVGASAAAPNVSTVDAVAPHDGVVRTITEAVAAAPR